MTPQQYYTAAAKAIPQKIRRHIMEEGLIDKARNLMEDKVFEYLFDVYEEFIDKTGDHDDWTCHQCRDHVYKEWLKLKPFLIAIDKLEAAA